jgi:BioD-like phosphotransacetylase family protein
MRSFLVAGRYGSGKTAICLGLALRLQQEGFKVGYFKPIGAVEAARGTADEDVVLMKHVLKMEEPLEQLVHIQASSTYLTRYSRGENLLHQITQAFRDLASTYQVVVVEGTTSPYVMAGLSLDAGSLAKTLDIPALLVTRPDNDFIVDRIIMYNDCFQCKGVPLLGNIFNDVTRPLLDKTRGVYKPLLEARGLPVLGVVPRRMEVSAPKVRQYLDVLGGELLAGEDGLEKVVEEVLIGAMTSEGALQYLRRVPNKLLITGGDRADLCLAALETSTAGLVLTGGMYPDVGVLARADEKQIPVILVHYLTYDAVERCHQVSRKITPSDLKGIRIAKENVDKHCDWPGILGLPQG